MAADQHDASSASLMSNLPREIQSFMAGAWLSAGLVSLVLADFPTECLAASEAAYASLQRPSWPKLCSDYCKVSTITYTCRPCDDPLAFGTC